MDDKGIYDRATGLKVHHLHPMEDHYNIDRYTSCEQCCANIQKFV